MNNANDFEDAGLWHRFLDLLHRRLVLPFLRTYDPVHQVALGSAIGIFVGLTPTVGVQMYSISVLWVIFRFVFRIRFNMVIGLAMVWISNPVTMIPMYYAFMVTGQWFQSWFGIEIQSIGYVAFSNEVERLSSGVDLGWFKWLWYAIQVLVMKFGWPMMLGSMAYAIPGFLVAYPVTAILLRRYRRVLAARKGLTYSEWKNLYEAKTL